MNDTTEWERFQRELAAEQAHERNRILTGECTMPERHIPQNPKPQSGKIRKVL